MSRHMDDDGAPASVHPAAGLRSVVVRYDDADRRTVYPPDAGDGVRLTTWLSADEAAFVDLRELR